MNKNNIKVRLFLLLIIVSWSCLFFLFQNSANEIPKRDKIRVKDEDCMDTTNSDELRSATSGKIVTSTIAKADAHVDAGNPNDNYAYNGYVYAGHWSGGWLETFFRFNFNKKPYLITNASIFLYMTYQSTVKPYNLPVYLIEETWSEGGITWNNKPSYGPLITTLAVTSNGFYSINVTDYIDGRNNISICVSYDSTNTGGQDWLNIHSRGWTIKPNITWIYEGEFGIFIERPDITDTLDYGQHLITWGSVGAGSDVKIELYNDSIFVENIIDQTENDGELLWNISYNDNYKGDKYQIKIIDINDNDINGMSDDFEILISPYIPPSSGGGGGGGGGGDSGEETIPFGDFYLIFALLAVVSVIVYTKRKIIIKKI